MEKMVGWLFIGTTVLLASMDAALGALILAAIAGGATYVSFVGMGRNHGTMNKSLDVIYQKIQDSVQKAIDARPEKEREALRKAAAKKLEALEKTRVFDESWNKRAAALISVGVFASPILITGVIAYLLRKKINVDAVIDELNDTLTPKSRTLTSLADKLRV